MSDEEELWRLTEGGNRRNSWSSWSSGWKLKDQNESDDYDDYEERESEKVQKEEREQEQELVGVEVKKNKVLVVESTSGCELAPHSAMNAGAGRVSDSPSPQDIRLLHELVEDIEKCDEQSKPREERVRSR